jgi:two-component system, cell cycle sensor histidine kinase and response regulator CckA
MTLRTKNGTTCETNRQLVGRLAAGVAHDFSGLFSRIQRHTSSVQAGKPLTAEQSESLREIGIAVGQGVSLIDRLQAYCHRNNGQAAAEDLNAVLAPLIDRLCATVSSNVEVIFEPGEGVPGVAIPNHLLEQVLGHLVQNSREAMPYGGTLRIGTALVEMEGSGTDKVPQGHQGRFVCLSLADTGCGMSDVTLSRLFKPFFTTKRGINKIGIGLSKVQGIVKIHRGWIEVKSELGFGSKFSIFLPAAI